MMLSALYLVTLIVDKDKVLDIFCILLQCKVYKCIYYIAAVALVGLGWPLLYVMYWRRMSRVQPRVRHYTGYCHHRHRAW